MSDRCLGHCCRRFPLSISYAELKENVELAAEGKPNRNFLDGAYVLDMLIPLGIQERVSSGEQREYFTCRHLLSSGDCGAYEARPQLCRNYPTYGHEGVACTNPHCQWEDGKNPPIAKDRLKKLLTLKHSITRLDPIRVPDPSQKDSR